MKLDTVLFIIGLSALVISAIVAWSWIFGQDGISINKADLG
jgi:hypothetical protein